MCGIIGIVPRPPRRQSRRMTIATLDKPAFRRSPETGAGRLPAAALRVATRRIAMLAYPDAQILDIVGPLEVFSRASRLLVDAGRKRPAYEVEILGMARGTFRVSSGVGLHADRSYDRAGSGIDTLLIAGGRGTAKDLHDRRLIAWIRRQAGAVRRLAAIWTGTILLARAG